jgi:Lon protease-like protein
MNEDLSALVHFGGTARLFPLPNLVLFPRALQPLHVFEPRYRQMTADALAGDRLIAPVLLRPGWEAEYAGGPAVFPVACLGRIVAEQRLPDGRFNLLLRGLCRIRLVEEVPTGKLYRCARAELLHDDPIPSPEAAGKLRRLLARHVRSWFAGQRKVLERVRALVHSEEPLSAVTDCFASAVPLDVEFKQELLETLDVAERTRRLIEHLKAKSPAPGDPRPFPPDFSEN